MFNIKILIVMISVFSCIFVSCSNESNSPIVFDQEKSLRNQSAQRAAQIIWTAENEETVNNVTMLENQTLEDNWVASTELSAEFSVKTESLFLSRLQLDEPIYPQLEGFGSLDVSILPPPLLSTLDSFFKSLQTKNIDASVFIEGKSYLKTLIEYDFKSLPQLTTWILGEPFLIDGSNLIVFEIPVRFVFDNDFCDGFVYCANYDEVFKIEQLVIGDLQK